MTDSYVNACPVCDAAKVQPTAGGARGRRAKTDYRCKDCGACFNDPVRRRRRGPNTPSGLAGRLDRADPDAVGGGD